MHSKDVEKLTGVTRAALREYEKKGLIQPQRTESKYRQYSEAEVERIKDIAIMSKMGLSLAEIKEVLENRQTLVIDVLAERRAKLVAVRNHHDHLIREIDGMMDYLKSRPENRLEDRVDGTLAQILYPIFRNGYIKHRMPISLMDVIERYMLNPKTFLSCFRQCFRLFFMDHLSPEDDQVQQAYASMLVTLVEVFRPILDAVVKDLGFSEEETDELYIDLGIDREKTALDNVAQADESFLQGLPRFLLYLLESLESNERDKKIATLVLGENYFSFFIRTHVVFAASKGVKACLSKVQANIAGFPSEYIADQSSLADEA